MAKSIGGYVGIGNPILAPDQVGAAPSNTAAIDGEATFTFSVPSNEGLTSVTLYVIVAITGGVVVAAGAGTSSPITVTGLTNGTAYTFLAFAINDFGLSPASPVSDSVTPVAGRGIFMGGLYSSPLSANTIDFVNIASAGNVTDFGDLSLAVSRHWGNSSLTRGLYGGGYATPEGTSDTIEYITISTAGNATDFGNMQAAGYWCAGGAHSKTRSVFHEGHAGPGNNNPSSVLSYVSVASTGNATDFGDVSDSGSDMVGCSSPVRGVFFHGAKGNHDTAHSDTIDYITIASTGNATDFGNRTAVADNAYSTALSSSVRGVVRLDGVMEYVTIASTGNVTDFGDPTVDKIMQASCSNNVRGIFGCGETNVIDYITIASTGNATDFGDISGSERNSPAACANGDGGHQ